MMILTSKLMVWSFLSSLVLSGILMPILPVRAEGLQPLLNVTSDEFPRRIYRFKAMVGASHELLSLSYVGKTWSLAEIRQGVAIEQFCYNKGRLTDNCSSGSLGLTEVVTLAAPEIDADHGGKITLHFLKNFATSSYEDFAMEIKREGDSWHLYAGQDDQAHPCSRLFFKSAKASLFGMSIGIDH